MSEYGLQGLRDEDGELKTQEHTYEWGDQEVTIKLKPPTITQQEEYEELGEDTEAGDLRDIMNQHLVEPQVDEEDLTMRELMCYLEGIMDYSVGEATGMAGDVQEELEARQDAGAGGN